MVERAERNLIAGIIAAGALACAVAAAVLPPDPVPAGAAATWARIDSAWGSHAAGDSFVIDAVAAGTRERPYSAAPLVAARHDALAVRGWAFDPDLRRSADRMVFRIDGGSWREARYHIARPDVAAVKGLATVGDSGFDATVPAGSLTRGRHTLELATITGVRPPNRLPQTVTLVVTGP